MQIANDPIMLKNPGVFWKTIIESSNVQVGQSILRLIAQTSAITDIDIGLGNKKIFFSTLKIIFFSPLKNIRRKQDLYWILIFAMGRSLSYKPPICQRYTYRVLQTIQMKLILLWVWAELAALGCAKPALKFK